MNTASPRIAYPDLDEHPLVRALEAVHAHPGDPAAALEAARALFASGVAVPVAVAGLVLSSAGPWARLCRHGVAAGDPRRARAAAELDRLGALAHGDLAAMLDVHGLGDALPVGAPEDHDAVPPAFAALRERMAADPSWGALAADIADFHRLQGTGPLAIARVLRAGAAGLVPVTDPDPGDLQELIGGAERRAPLVRAMAAFSAGGPPVDVLLYGAPGTGKSATVRALAAAHRDTGLRLVQLDRDRLGDLGAVFRELAGAGPRCVVLLDDLVFDEGARTDRVLRAALEGDAAARPGNVAVWATSNRMKLLHETLSDRADDVEDALGRGERAALATRFAVRVGFTAVAPEEFVRIAIGLMRRRGLRTAPDTADRALRWGRERGLTPRAARQFADAEASAAALAAISP